MSDQGQPAPVIDDDDDDSGGMLKKSQLIDSEMDIAPMIDCTFLLLIFFIVCSHIGQSAAVDLPKARYGVPVPSKNSVVLTVAQGDGEVARVFRGDGLDPKNLIAAATVAEQEEAVAQYVAERMASDDALEHVLIKAARQMKHREVVRVARAAVRNTEVNQLYVAVMESK